MTDYLKIPEVARRLDVSEPTVRRMVKGGKLPSVFIGGAYRVSEEDLEKYLEAARVRPGGDSGKAQAPPPSYPTDGVYRITSPEEAAEMIVGAGHYATGLASLWNQDAELYEQFGREMHPYRSFEMRAAVNTLYEQFFGALDFLRQDADAKGYSPDVQLWGPQITQILFSAGASIRALAELCDLITQSSEDDAERENLRARREEFDVRAPALLTEDLHWPEAVEEARVATGLA